MSDPKSFNIDRYAVWTHNLNGPINPLGSLATGEDESMKIVVTYADHVEALRQASLEPLPSLAYEQGQRDALASRVLTADDPQPAVGSVVLVRGFWSFCRGADGFWYWGDVRWEWSHWWATFGDDTPTLIYAAIKGDSDE